MNLIPKLRFFFTVKYLIFLIITAIRLRLHMGRLLVLFHMFVFWLLLGYLFAGDLEVLVLAGCFLWVSIQAYLSMYLLLTHLKLVLQLLKPFAIILYAQTTLLRLFILAGHFQIIREFHQRMLSLFDSLAYIRLLLFPHLYAVCHLRVLTMFRLDFSSQLSD